MDFMDFMSLSSQHSIAKYFQKHCHIQIPYNTIMSLQDQLKMRD